MEKLEGTKHIIYSGNRDIAEKVLRTMDKINEIVEWINTQEKPRESSDFTKTPWVVENKPQDQYKQ